MACPPQGGLPHSGVTSPPQGGLLHPNTFVLNQTMVNNEGCSFGTVTANVRNETNLAVEQVVQMAEARHLNTVTPMAETANHEHLQQMANLAREAQLALQRQAEEHQLALQLALQREAVTHADNMVRHHAAQSLKVSQLEMALELQENRTCETWKRWSPAPGAPTTAPSTVLQRAPTTTM